MRSLTLMIAAGIIATVGANTAAFACKPTFGASNQGGYLRVSVERTGNSSSSSFLLLSIRCEAGASVFTATTLALSGKTVLGYIRSDAKCSLSYRIGVQGIFDEDRLLRGASHPLKACRLQRGQIVPEHIDVKTADFDGRFPTGCSERHSPDLSKNLKISSDGNNYEIRFETRPPDEVTPTKDAVADWDATLLISPVQQLGITASMTKSMLPAHVTFLNSFISAVIALRMLGATKELVGEDWRVLRYWLDLVVAPPRKMSSLMSSQERNVLAALCTDTRAVRAISTLQRKTLDAWCKP